MKKKEEYTMENSVNNTGEELDTAAEALTEESAAENTSPETDETPESDGENTAESTDAVPPEKKFFEKIKDKLIEIGWESIVVRLLISWIIVSCYQIFVSEYKFNTFEFFNGIKVWTYFLLIPAVFITLTLIRNRTLDRILLFFSTLTYCCYAVFTDNRFYFTAGLCIFMGAVAVYCVGDTIKVRLKTLPTVAAVAVLGIAFTLFTGLLTSFLYLRHWSPNFDFGIFSQMFYYMKDTFQPLTTCERDGLLSHFAVHFSPVYYLMLPVFCIFPSPVTLLIMQAAIIASGLIPLYLICKKYKISNAAIILFSLCYVLMPSMANGCFYFLHENKFLTALILWLVYALEKDKWIPAVIFAFLVFSVKEDAPVYAAVLGLYFVLSGRRIAKGSAVTALSVVYFVVVSWFMSKYGLGTMNYRYENFIYDNSDSLITVIKAVILNPIYAIYESFDEEKILFILQMLIPVAFMPLMSKKPSRIILFIPLFLINLMSDYQYQHDINFQYTYGSAAFLFYLMIMNYSDMKPEFRKKALAVAATSSVLMFMCNTYYRTDGFRFYKDDTESGSIETIDKALELVPKDASVVSTTFFIPNLADRREIYELAYTKYVDDVEYVVLDLRCSLEPYSLEQFSENPVYETVTNIPGQIAIFRNTSVSKN